MEDKKVEQPDNPNLLSIEKLKNENVALTKRVETLETQIKDMINELKTGSYTIAQDNESGNSDKKKEYQERLNKVLGHGKIN